MPRWLGWAIWPLMVQSENELVSQGFVSSYVIPSEARNLLFAESGSSGGKQQVPQRLTPFRNDKSS
jgi:hypothetical protein